jgi:hypothetical protein
MLPRWNEQHRAPESLDDRELSKAWHVQDCVAFVCGVPITTAPKTSCLVFAAESDSCRIPRFLLVVGRIHDLKMMAR